MTKYDALGAFLRRQDACEVPMRFQEVESVLGFPLPKSARDYSPWWANQTSSGHSQCRAWMEAGWRTSRLDLAGESVIFVQHEAGRTTGRGLAGVAEASRPYAAAPSIRLTMADLTPAGRRLIKTYEVEAGGNLAAAVARAIHDAALARRAQLIDAIPLSGARGDVDSVDLIREDRDGR